MRKWLILLAAGSAVFAQEASRPDWQRDLAAAREAYAKANYGEAAVRAASAASGAASTAGNEAGELDALRTLVAAQRAGGNFEDALRALGRALEVTAAVDGPRSQRGASLLAEVAAVERAGGHVEAAMEAIQRAIDMREAAPGLRGEDLARDLTTRAMLEMKFKHDLEAAELLTRAVELWNRSAPGDPQLLPALETLATLYRDTAHYEEAEPLFLQAMRIREAAMGPDSADVIAAVDSLAYCYFGLKRFAEAEAYYKRLLELWEKTAGADHPMRALTFDKMAEFYAFQQRYEEGEKAAQAALDMRGRYYLASLNQTGRLILMQARLNDAEELYRRAIQIGDLAKAPDEVMDPLLRVFGGILKEQNKTEEAAAVEKRWKEALIRKADREGRRPSPVQMPQTKKP